ncbi:hypothetical protein [Paenibacillus sp. 23TSA30-6]|uniref:hypothetical protein n=1 Tax=Paenibacillus sp. 23TSA30-6 TaxID=2546104 RepID=UPI0017877F71|nr:hypothetical protein [Paenibacillus sp. 23TSA30-6]MBE0335122.1 hypothetical protein [Paenibacillus sp. 23TSA30-6]
MKDQSALGGKSVNRLPEFNSTRLAHVTSTKNYEKYGRIEVVFLDYSQPVPVWVIGGIDREPVEGDTVIVGYLDNRKDTPYLAGFLRNSSYGTNFITVKRDLIKLQLPVYEIGVKDGIADKDVQGHLLNESKQQQRAYVELTPEHALLSYPTDKDGELPPVTVKITSGGAEISCPVPDEAPAYIHLSAGGFEFFHPTGKAIFKLPKGDIAVEKG